jgi:hypothetical protein
VAIAARSSYVAEVHARVRPDLEKALEGHRMNVELAKAYGVDTAWSRGSERQAVAIMELLARDTPGSYAAPADGAEGARADGSPRSQGTDRNGP